MDGSSTEFIRTLRSRLRHYGAAPFIEFERRWYSGDTITGYLDRIRDLLDDAGVPDGAAVGVVVRNRPVDAAAILGFVTAERSFSILYSMQSAPALAKDVEELRLAALVAADEDWAPEVVEAAQRVGTVGISAGTRSIEYVEGLDAPGEGPFGVAPEQLSIGLLTSGTTGPPKRIPITVPMLQHAAASGKAAHNPGQEALPDLLYWPLSGIGGLCPLMATVHAGRRMALLERFTVKAWVDVVKRHRIERVGVVPATIRMVLDADVPKEDLASLQFVFGGSAPLEPETRELFERTYGVSIVWGYGATEFAGTIIAWTPELYRRYGQAKRESVGRPVAGVEVRVVDPETGGEVAAGQVGLLEGRVELLGPDWIRTTDLASLDEDGFVTLHGRNDGAIIRGGFKILPERVQRALIEHPGVRDAAVVGIPDARLGEVPFAAVEPADGAERPDPEQLKEWVRERLPAHHVPVRVRIVDELPRTGTLKVRRGALRELAD